MSERDDYPAGVPCWVDTLAPDLEAAERFYAEIFGWELTRPAVPASGPAYHVARLRGRDVAGIGELPDPSTPAGWTTYVAVEDVARAVAAAEHAGGAVRLGPTAALPAGIFAVVADPDGAALGLWEARERRGAQRVNEPSAWAMSALQTADPERAAAFYSELLGWRPETFDAGGVPVMLMRLPGYVGGEPEQPVPRDVVAVVAPLAGAAQAAHWSVDFWIDDADRAMARTEELGGRVLLAAHEIPGFRRAVLADPAGASFSVSQLLGHG